MHANEAKCSMLSEKHTVKFYVWALKCHGKVAQASH